MSKTTPNPGSTQRFKDTIIKDMNSLPTYLQKDNLKAIAKKTVVVTVFAAFLNFAGKKLIRKDMGFVSTPMKAVEFAVSVGAGVLVHDALQSKQYI